MNKKPDENELDFLRSLFDDSEVAGESLNDRLRRRADHYIVVGMEQFYTSEFEAAKQSWQTSLNIYRKLGMRQAEEVALSNLGLACEGKGNLVEASNYFGDALKIAQEVNDLKGQGEILANLGNIDIDLGQYAQAIERYQEGLKIARELKSSRLQAACFGNLGNAFQILGEYKMAIDCLQESLKLFQQLRDIREISNVLSNKGWIDYLLGNLQQSLENYEQSLKIKQGLEDRRGEVHTIGRMGAIYGELGNWTKAIKCHQEGVKISQKIQYRIGELDSLKNLGEAFWKSGNLKQAEACLYEAIDLGEAIRVELTSDSKQKVSFFETQDLAYRLLQSVLVDSKKFEEALEISERSRSPILREVLAKKIDNRELALAKISIKRIKQIAREQNATFVEYSVIYQSCRIKEVLTAKESNLFIWVVSPSGKITFQSVDLKPMWQEDRTSLTDFVSQSRESIGVRSRDAVAVQSSTSKNSDDSYLHELYKILIHPIASHLPSDENDRVIFIPQESLFLVPFAALTNSNRRYLVEKHTILTSPSIQIFESIDYSKQKDRWNTGEILVIGNPTMPVVSLKPGDPPQQLSALPGAEDEAVKVAKILKVKAILGSCATKKAVLEKLPRSRIIHLATHGLLDSFIESDVPGAIALAPSESDNGLLMAEEILSFDLQAELVVLSACNTGKGRLTGDGVMGLARSLILAGASSIVVSLWSVPDAPTAELMQEFYDRLQQNLDKARALRQAMLDIMKKNTDPKAWAGFTLIGKAETLNR